jgi:hypothetical protein
MKFNRGKVLFVFSVLLMFALQGELAAQSIEMQPTGQSIEVGDTLTLSAYCLNWQGNPLTGRRVDFLVVSGDGSVLPLVDTSNAGYAYTVFTAGTSAGTNRVVGYFVTPFVFDTIADTLDIEVIAGDIDHFNLMVSDDTLDVGEYAAVEITAKDSYDNTITDYADSILLSLTGSTADPSQVAWIVLDDTLAGLSADIPEGSFVDGVCTIYVSDQKAETVSGVTATDVDSHTGATSEITWLATGVDRLLVELLSAKVDTINVNDTTNIQVTAVDTFGNVTGVGLPMDVELSASEAGVVFPDGEIQSLDNSVGSFSLVAETACSGLIITVTDTANSSIYGSSNPIEVLAVPGDFDHFSFIVSPDTLDVGEYTMVEITARDTNDMNIGGTNPDTLTLSLSGSTADPSQVAWIVLGDTLAGLSAIVPEGSFVDGILNVYVANQKAETASAAITDEGSNTWSSSGITWLATGVDRFLVELLSAKVDTINLNDTTDIQVTAMDAFGNVTTVGLPMDVELSASEAGVVFPDGEIQSLDNSVGSFSLVAEISCSGLIITVTDTANPSIYGNSNPIEVVEGAGVEEIPAVSNISAKFGSGEILYSVAVGGNVEIKVYNKAGIVVGTLVNGMVKPGYYQVSLKGLNLSSDIYFVVMKGPGITKNVKTLLIK